MVYSNPHSDILNTTQKLQHLDSINIRLMLLLMYSWRIRLLNYIVDLGYIFMFCDSDFLQSNGELSSRPRHLMHYHCNTMLQSHLALASYRYIGRRIYSKFLPDKNSVECDSMSILAMLACIKDNWEIEEIGGLMSSNVGYSPPWHISLPSATLKLHVVS